MSGRDLTPPPVARVDWIAVYDDVTKRCFYIPAAELADGKSVLALRLAPARNGQRKLVRTAADYTAI